MKSIRLSAVLVLIVIWIGIGSAWCKSFVVEDIQIEGIQRISAGTVFNYLPIKVGEEFNEPRSAEIIRALFKSGFFKDIRLEQQGNVLIVNVVERPAIASIKFTGNKEFGSEELKESLKTTGLAEGRVFNKSTLEKIEQELRRQYYSNGKYSVKIKSTSTPLERNRVAISIDISEGTAAKIKEINIVGNSVFEEEDLLEQLESTIPTWYSFLSKGDQYSKQKLASDLEKLSSYYLDRGYLKFNVNSTQVSITPDKKDIYITINITEGKQYLVSEVKISGKLLYPDEDLFKAVKIREGDVFSRRIAVDSADRLTDLMSNDGYAFANINTIPEVDDKNNEVALTFFIDPGRRIYVRRINFSGNSRTRDEVLRREMRQIENAWLSTGNVKRSTTRLERLGYFTEVNVETPAVPGTSDQVDVNYSVVEQPAGAFLAGIGYSQSQGISLTSSITQENFLGSGVKFGANINTSDADTALGFNFTNPYHTIDGVSRGFNIIHRERDAKDLGVSDYTTDVLLGKVNYGIPVSETNTLYFGFGVERIQLDATSTASTEVVNFQEQQGNKYTNIVSTAALVDDKRNKSAIFADRGILYSVSAEFSWPGSDLEYIKIDFRNQRFIPLTRNITLMLNGEIGLGYGYGNQDGLPFLEHYYAGGISSIRGYADNSLGTRDSRNEPFGGDFRTVGNVEAILPMPFFGDDRAWRMTAFMDIGNVFDRMNDFDVSDLRYSIGLGVRWLSPLGPIKMSFAEPLNSKNIDDIQRFQFTFGSVF